MTQQELNGTERDFFATVSRAGFINPFSHERTELELKISGLPASASRKKRIEGFVSAVNERIAALEEAEKADINLYRGEDRQIMERVFLIEQFYRFKDKFDEVIANQLASGNVVAKVPFYSEALAATNHRGFDEESFKRYFALAFQIRRAFYFIDRGLVGNSPSMQLLRWNLWNNVFTHNIDLYDRYLRNQMEDFSTLLLGETGTGKGTAAQAIGRSGFIPLDRRRKSFVESFTQSFISLNLSQFPETLIESALFGHKKGAFTGAVEDYQGVFERCSPHGAILLDEIGEVSYPIQIKLLQVLQERVFSPVGSQKQSRFHGRVIAATNRSKEQIHGPGGFREDFYYRLCSDIIVVPPLRQRIQENPEELQLLLSKTVERLIGKPSPELVEMVSSVIDANLEPGYPWPGNVRELEQCTRRVLLKGMYTGESDFKGLELDRQLIQGIEKGNIDAASLVSGYCYLLYQRHQNFEEVARRTGLDRRTVKKYIQDWTTGDETS
ncbi:MAG TPA: sigma 54-interacting transcriptional regulator [Desulfosalsimonadaceae bacterium]|nr:sigma 54-interacting transcriptional regulator [Desulfosalsimonadaceae bacterium]